MTDATLEATPATDPEFDEQSARLLAMLTKHPNIASTMANCMIGIVEILTTVFELIHEGKQDDPLVRSIIDVGADLGLVDVTTVSVDVVGGGDVTNDVETSVALDQAWAEFQGEFGTVEG